MVTKKQKPVIDTQRIMESKHTTKPHRKRAREKERKRKNVKVVRKQQNDNKYMPINNLFKCKWGKYFKVHTVVEYFKQKTYLYADYKSLTSDVRTHTN